MSSATTTSGEKPTSAESGDRGESARSVIDPGGALAGVAQVMTDTARDIANLAVGLGVLGFQRAQVRRRELQRQAYELLGRATGRC